MLTRDDIKEMKKTMRENEAALIDDITNMMDGRDTMDFYTPDGDLIVDEVAIGFKDKETDTFPNVDAVVKKDGEIYLQCDILGSDYEIALTDVEISYEDLITIANGMHKVLEWEKEREKDIFTAFDKDDYVTYDAFMKFIKDFYAPKDYHKALDVEEFMNAQLAETFKKAKEKFA